MRPCKIRLICLRSRLKIRKSGFLLLKATKRKKKRPLNLKTSGLPTNSPRERTTHTTLATKLLTMENIMFAR